MRRILAIDPGSEQSAWVLWDGAIVEHGYEPNRQVIAHVCNQWLYDLLAIEMMAGYGMTAGREVFETCVMIGRCIQAREACAFIPWRYVYRKDIKLALCGVTSAKDKDVREALIDRFGGKATALGTAKAPGPLRGITGDQWAALAVAVVAAGAKETA